MNSKTARVLVSLVLAGCAPPPEGGTPTGAPIVGGEAGGDPAVVVLQNYQSGGLCSGSLIAPRVVLTAKHCVQQPFAEGPASPSQIVVGVGDNIRRLTATLRVQTITTTPGVYTEDSRGGIGSGLVGEDVAVLLLQSGVAGIEPIPVRRADPSPLTGETITASGFGQTPSGQVGVKYTVMGRVQSVMGDLIYVGPLTCQGDSGGPMITSDREVAGVVSFGAGSCGSGYGAYNAVFNYLDMIDEVLTAGGSCLDDGEERCDGGDNDCDDLIDETCTAIGGTCAADDECLGLTCRDTVAGRVCTQPCDPLRPEFGCGPGLYCAFAEGCDGFCVPMASERGSLPIDAECTSNEECISLFCADPGDGRRRCVTACRGDEGMCLAGEACVANPGECGSCVQEDILRAERGIGEGCEDASECRSGNCYEDGARSYCTRACDDTTPCPTGFHCRGDVCASGPPGEIGDRCLGNGDCNASAREFCATRGDQTWCTRVCSDSDPCPEGFDCVAAGGAHVCAPRLGLLGEACSQDGDCVSDLCSIPEGETAGVCSRLCGPDAPCTVGFECRRTEDGLSAMCVEPVAPTSGGSCAVGAGSGPGLGSTLLAALVATSVWIRRRRRNR